MFEENKNTIEQDLLFRSILEDSQEAVPERVWNGIEKELDILARRRSAMIWFRRTAVGFAAAATVAVGVFFGIDRDIQHSGPAAISLVSPEGNGSPVAVVEPEQNERKELLAMNVEKTSAAAGAEKEELTCIVEETADVPETYNEDEVPQIKDEMHTDRNRPEQKQEQENTAQKEDRFPEIWPDEEVRTGKKRGASIVLSGLTGTNSAQNNGRINPMMRPAISSAPKQTGIRETSTNSSYGVPVSFGVGLKFDLSPRWSMSAGLNYTLLTRRFYGTYNQVGGDGVILNSVSSDIRNTQHYIGIPVNVYYNIINHGKVNLYAYAGGSAERCIGDKYLVLDSDIRHSEKAEGIQLSTNIGLGAEFILGRHLGIYIDPSLRYYFDCEQPKSIRTVQPLMFGFEMGLRFRL